MITSSLILIDGKNLKKEALMISLTNAKQLVIGSAPEFGWIVHVAASSTADLSKAFLAFAKIPGVENVTALALHQPQ